MSLLLFDIPDQMPVIKLYGEEVQHVVAMEECSELTQAISKNYRAQNLPNTCETRDKARLNLIEEAADVIGVPPTNDDNSQNHRAGHSRLYR